MIREHTASTANRPTPGDLSLARHPMPRAIAGLLVDNDFCLKSYTPAFNRLFQQSLVLDAEDLGRPVESIFQRLTSQTLASQSLISEIRQSIRAARDCVWVIPGRHERTFQVQVLPENSEGGLLDDPFLGHLLSFVDVTWLEHVEQSLGMKSLMGANDHGVMLADADHHDYPIVYVNKGFEHITGYRAREVLGRNCRFLQDDDRDQQPLAEVRMALAEGRETKVVLRNYRKDGTPFWNSLVLKPIQASSGKITHFLGLQRDVTAEQRNKRLMNAHQRLRDEELKERAHSTLRSISDAVIRIDVEGVIDYVNPMAETLLGSSARQLRGHASTDVLRLLNEQTREPLEDPLRQSFVDGTRTQLHEQSVLINSQGKELAVQGSAAPIFGLEGEILGAVLTLCDVTETRRTTQQLLHLATHDAVTGLSNRAELEKRLTQTLESARRRGTEHALCYLDVDQFRLVNDTAGYLAGDELLRQLASLIQQQIWSRDMLARLGDDEFGLLLAHCPLDKAIEVTKNVLDAVRGFQFVWEGHPFDLTLSLGLVPINARLDSVVQLMSRGNIACYTAKQLGGDQIHVYQAEDSEPARLHDQLRRVAELAEALRHERFCLFCQSIVPLQDDRKQDLHYEVLLRLRDRDGQLIPPLDFIPAAERHGVMNRIDRWVIRTALRRYPEIFGLDSGVGLTINLSGCSLSDSKLLPFIREQLQAFEVPAERICFEITETAAISHLDRAAALIHALKEDGCRFALDDFGSGLSSFTYLKTLPVDYLKIDGSFVRDMARSKIDHGMVAAIHQIGRIVGIETVAECVENATVLELLREIGVDYAQGYVLGRPVEIESLAMAATG